MLPILLAPRAAAMIATAWVNRFATSVRLSALFSVGYGFVEAHDGLLFHALTTISTHVAS